MAIWLRKFLGKLEHVEKFNFWRPLQIARRMRRSWMEGDVKWHKFTKNDKNNGGIQFCNIMWGYSAISKLKISKNKIFVLSNEIIHKNLAAVQKTQFLSFI